MQSLTEIQDIVKESIPVLEMIYQNLEQRHAEYPEVYEIKLARSKVCSLIETSELMQETISLQMWSSWRINLFEIKNLVQYLKETFEND